MKRFKLSLVFLITILFIQCRKIQFKKNCCTHTLDISLIPDSESVTIWAPNAFTPNQDGRNDFYQIMFKNVSSEDFFIRIFQKRKGLFESTDQNFKWNGVINQKVKEGVYSFFISGKTEAGSPFEANGNFCLLLNDGNDNTDIKNCASCTFSDMIDPRSGFVLSSAEILSDCN